jgi:hypothetical protein
MADAASPAAGTDTDAPPVRSFQMDGGAIGAPEQSVNLFRGDVGFSLPLVSLDHRAGLGVSITAGYGSNVAPVVGTWNAAAPTGVLGVGWSLPLEYVALQPAEPDAPGSGSYVLAALGGARPLTRVGTDAASGAELYATSDYQFWSVRHFPADERWEVVTEDGIVRTFGGGLATGAGGARTSTGDAIAWGVRWGAWTGASAQTAGQSQYARAWYATSLRNPYGEEVTFAYDQTTRAVGVDGLAATRELYLDRIVDADGRTVQLTYGAKDHRPGQVVEYVDPHESLPTTDPTPYQDTYETRYLDAIAVSAESGAPISTILMDYSVDNVAAGDQGDTAPLLYKRYLRAVHSAGPDGIAAPGIRFTYGAVSEPAPGALGTVLQPSGGTVAYDYAPLPLPGDRSQSYDAPVAGATPSVFHGPGYTVVVWYEPASGAVFASVASWSGTWSTQQVWSDSVPGLDVAQLEVLCRPASFGIHFQAGGDEVARLYRSDPTQLGGWQLEDVFPIALGAGAPPTQRAGGTDFYILANPAFAQGGPVQGNAWQWRSRTWQSLGAAAPAGVAAPVIAAGPEHYVAAGLDPAGANLMATIGYRDENGDWQAGAAWQQAVSGVAPAATAPGVALVTTAWSATAVVPSPGGTTSTAYLWALDTSYQLAGDGAPGTLAVTLPAPGQDGPAWPIAAPVQLGSVVAVGGAAVRYGGGADAQLAPDQQWLAGGFPAPATSTDTYTFAFDEDLVVMAADDGQSVTTQLCRFDPTQGPAGGWTAPEDAPASGTAPAAGGGFLLVGNQLFRWDGAQPAWVPVPGTLPYIDAATVQVLGSYMAYMTTGGTPGALLLANGGATQATLPADAVGLGPCGPATVVTYPAPATSLATASTITLSRVVGGAVTGALSTTSVATAVMDDGMGSPQPIAYQYDTSSATVDADSGIAQFTHATRVPGTSDPSSQPFGHTDVWYSNGVPFNTSAFYAQGTPYNYVGVLNGQLLATLTYAAGQSEPNQTEVSWWSTFDQRPDQPGAYLPAAYARRTRVVRTRDGLQSAADYTYNETLGLVAAVATTGADSEGNPVTRTETTTRAIEVSEYSVAMTEAHVLDAVALTTYASAPQGAPRPVVVGARATTYRDWSAQTGGWCFAPERRLTWMGTGAPTPFGGGNLADWQPASSVQERGELGVPTALTAPDGVTEVALYADRRRRVVGRFRGVAPGEVAYCGFEPYEGDGGCTLGAGAAVTTADAASGLQSLRVPPGAGAAALTATVTPQPANRAGAFVATGWVSTGEGFAADAGAATWTLTAEQGGHAIGGPQVVDVADTAGLWARIEARIDLAAAGVDPAQPVTVTLTIANAKSRTGYLVDDVRLTPVTCGLGVNVYDPLGQVSARIDTTGQRAWLLRDEQQRATGSVDALARPATFAARYLSRAGNGDAFAAADPNTALSLGCRSGGIFEPFAGGRDWQTRWTPSDPAAWTAAGGTLTHAGGAAGTLSLAAPGFDGDWALGFAVSADTPLTEPLSVGVGSASVAWDPADGQWALPGGARRDLPLLTLTAAVVGPAVEVGRVTDELRAAFRGGGAVLTAGTPIAASGTGRWIIPATPGTVPYWILTAGDTYNIYRLPRRWVVAIVGGVLALYAEGQRVYSGAAGGGAPWAASITTADAIGLRELLVVSRPGLQVTYSDGLGRTRQVQMLDPSA